MFRAIGQGRRGFAVALLAVLLITMSGGSARAGFFPDRPVFDYEKEGGRLLEAHKCRHRAHQLWRGRSRLQLIR